MAPAVMIFSVEAGNPALGLSNNLTPELAARARERDAILMATLTSVPTSLPLPVTGAAGNTANAPVPPPPPLPVLQPVVH